MEDLFHCPLCCNMQFNTKQALVEHLSNIKSKLLCPICKNNFSTLDILIDHLKLGNCDLLNTSQHLKLEGSTLVKEEVPITDFSPLDGIGDPYHQVILKESQTQTGTKRQIYNCMLCNVYASSLSEFLDYPCEKLKYSRIQCPVDNENTKSQIAPKQIQDVKTTDKFECEICSSVFPTSISLNTHKRMHDNIKLQPNLPSLETDEPKDSDDNFLCSICDKLITKEYKTIHQNSHKTKLICDICNKEFRYRGALERHFTVHTVDKVTVTLGKQHVSLPYECRYCNRKFAWPYQRSLHERTHTGVKLHVCEICNKSFRVSSSLTVHMRTHTGELPYACPHCTKRFMYREAFNHHLQTHSELRAFKCQFCSKEYKTLTQLTRHKKTHTKPFSCQKCNRSFATLHLVRVHSEQHARQNTLKFSCSLCGASYARAFEFYDHVKQAHAEVKDEDKADTVLIKTEDWVD